MKTHGLLHVLPLVALAVCGLAVVILIILSSCTPSPESISPRLTFRAPMQAGSGEELQVTLEVHNEGDARFPGDDAFDGVMQVRAANGVLRARIDIVSLGPIDPGESASLAAWRGKLEPGSYRLTWGAPGNGYTMVDFSIVDDGRFYLGDEVVTTRHEGDPPIEIE